MQVISPKKPKPGPAMPQSSSVTASVITAIEAMTTSATRSSMRVAPARIEVAASARQRGEGQHQRPARARRDAGGQEHEDQRREQRHDRCRAEEVPGDDVPNRALRFGVVDQRGG